jgi:hypothetical protein
MKKSKYSIEDGVTQSLLSAFVHCRVLCRNIIDGWERKGPEDYMNLGILIHDVLGTRYAKDRVPNANRMSARLKAVSNTLTFSSAAAHSNALCVSDILLQEYFRFYAKRDAKVQWIAGEETFDIKWKGFRLRGQIDATFIPKDGRVWIKETKTTSQLSSEQENLLAFDFQSLFYATVKQAQAPNKRIGGFVYDMVRNPGLRVGVSENEDAYMKRVRADIRRRPEFYFMRYTIPITKQMLDDFAKELHAKLNEFMDWLDGDLYTFSNQRACRGRMNCAFIAKCAGSNAMYSKTRELFRELKGAAK